MKDDINPVYKNEEKYFEKKTVGELVLYQIFQMPIKDKCTIGWTSILCPFYL